MMRFRNTVCWLFLGLIIPTAVFAQTILFDYPYNQPTTQNNSTTIDTSYFDSLVSQIPQPKPTITISTDPQYPSPHEEITITAINYSFSIDESQNFWYINDKLVESGLGLKSIKTKTGKAGEKINLKIVMKNTSGEFTSTASIIPSELSILDEAQTYTPPFYRGQSLPIFGSTHKFIAISDFRDSKGQRIGDENIVYTWRLNGETVPEVSGTGKNVYVYKPANEYRSASTITVLAKVVGSNQQNKQIEKINYASPKVLIYAQNSIYGSLFNKLAAGNMTLLGKEVEVRAYPLYYNIGNYDSLTYKWRIDGSRIDTKNSPSITLGRNGDVTGSTNISANIYDTKNPNANSTSRFSLSYGQNNR